MRLPQVSIAEVRGPPTTHTHASSSAQPHPLLALPAAPPVLCDVCCEHVPRSTLRGCAACSHRYCASCVDKYWTGAIYSGNHARLLCMYGGCGVFATDIDVASVVSRRTYRKMLYFRSRDVYNHCPGARWCAVDLCWEYLGVYGSDRDGCPRDGPSGAIVSCTRCAGKTCTKCEREVSSSTTVHVCASRKPNKAHNALFGLWAVLHTKSCPECAARIQRNHGCSHMTCTRCSSYFCWRCKGFLNNGCPLPGRACICDRVMTAAAYSGLAVAGVIGSPLIIAAVLLGGPPYLAYRLVKARQGRARRGDSRYANGLQSDAAIARARHARPAARSILQPDELYGNDDDFDSGSTRYTAFSDIVVAESRVAALSSATVSSTRSRRSRASQRMSDGEALERTEADEEMSLGMISNSAERRTDDHVDVAAVETLEGADTIPGVSVESCRVIRPFVLERRRGSAGPDRAVRSSIA